MPDCKTDNGENARMHETNTYAMQCNAHNDMIKCNTQANDMAMTANNWRTPGTSATGRYRGKFWGVPGYGGWSGAERCAFLSYMYARVCEALALTKPERSIDGY